MSKLQSRTKDTSVQDFLSADYLNYWERPDPPETTVVSNEELGIIIKQLQDTKGLTREQLDQVMGQYDNSVWENYSDPDAISNLYFQYRLLNPNF